MPVYWNGDLAITLILTWINMRFIRPNVMFRGYRCAEDYQTNQLPVPYS